jgi:hypothetical protein
MLTLLGITSTVTKCTLVTECFEAVWTITVVIRIITALSPIETYQIQ